MIKKFRKNAQESTGEHRRALHSTALEVAIIFISLVKTYFFITGCVIQCPIHLFKSIKSINS
jgi:hypothetical protein